ncbi:hypothetical protein [uncultured Amnibacterium sp.]|uniref:hypothetical protein n=1 Tax=uncultured Amnibacterium sp. TaxID=1631851 RepID=UPI0035C95A64
MLRRAAPLAAAALLVLGLAGCGARTAAPTSASPQRTTASPTPLITPSAEAGEVARATFGGGATRDGAGRLPATGQVAVEVACSGADAGVLTWRLETEAGVSLGLSGQADCSAPPTTSWLGITADPRPDRVRIVLEPGDGVVAGWAVVRIGTP